jgi:hypothetical protein
VGLSLPTRDMLRPLWVMRLWKRRSLRFAWKIAGSSVSRLE